MLANNDSIKEKKRVFILIAHCGVEIIPKEIFNHPQCQRSIELFNNCGKILDAAHHHSAMQKLENKDQRGRPDILHISLLLLLNSPLADENLLEIYFSTRDGRHFKISPITRIPREGNRFKGLIYQLLNENHNPKDPPYFIEKITDDFISFLNFINKDLSPNRCKPILFSTTGKNEKLFPFIQKTIELHEIPLFIIGGFQKGQIDSTYSNHVEDIISVYNKGLESWTIISRLISAMEQALEIL